MICKRTFSWHLLVTKYCNSESYFVNVTFAEWNRSSTEEDVSLLEQEDQQTDVDASDEESLGRTHIYIPEVDETNSELTTPQTSTLLETTNIKEDQPCHKKLDTPKDEENRQSRKVSFKNSEDSIEEVWNNNLK